MLAELKEAGLPTGLHDLEGKDAPLIDRLDDLTDQDLMEVMTADRPVELKGERDATPFYSAAFELAVFPETLAEHLPFSGIADDPELGRPIDPQMAAHLAEFVAQEEMFFSLMRQAGAHDRVDWGLNYDSFDSSGGHAWSGARAAARRMLELSLYHQSRGQADDAAAACTDILRMSNSFGGEVRQWMQRWAVDAMAVAGLEDTLSRTEPSAEALGRARERLAYEMEVMTRRHIMETEVALLADDLRYFERSMARETLESEKMIARPDFIMRTAMGQAEEFAPSADRARSVRRAIELVRLWVTICPGAYRTAAASDLREAAELLKTADVPDHEYARQVSEELASLDPSSNRAATLRGRLALVDWAVPLSVADVALATEQYRIAHGRWPDALGGQDAGSFVDPFTGEPMVYVPTPTGRLIYSVGKNGIDEDGRGRRDQGDDVAFRLFDVEARNRAQTD